MIVKDHYVESIKHEYYSLQLFIEFLVCEKKVLKFTDTEDKLTYFLQDKFSKKMNEYLAKYEVKRKEETKDERSSHG